jgi:hypothetical protein
MTHLSEEIAEQLSGVPGVAEGESMFRNGTAWWLNGTKSPISRLL